MPYRKLTLRRMKTVTRKGGRLINELDSLRKRMKNWLSEVEDLETDSRALHNMNKAIKQERSQVQ